MDFLIFGRDFGVREAFQRHPKPYGIDSGRVSAQTEAYGPESDQVPGFWLKCGNPGIRSGILGVGYWILDLGYLVLNIGCQILDIGYWIFDLGYWILDIGYWTSDIGYWILDGYWTVMG